MSKYDFINHRFSWLLVVFHGYEQKNVAAPPLYMAVGRRKRALEVALIKGPH